MKLIIIAYDASLHSIIHHARIELFSYCCLTMLPMVVEFLSKLSYYLVNVTTLAKSLFCFMLHVQYYEIYDSTTESSSSVYAMRS